MPSSPAFRMFGFPVHVRPGFYMFMILLVALNGTEFGVPFAIFVALFTLLHELGHAFAARATGANAQISLDFMAGYAAFTPTRHLSRWERAGISFAGPGIQILVGGIAYLAVRGAADWPDTHIQTSLLFAGVGIGLFNLLPILPFDGGNILEQLVDAVSPTHSRRIMIIFTIAISVGGMIYMATQPKLIGYIFFMALPLLSVGQMVSANRSREGHQKSQEALARAEALAWASGDVSRFAGGNVPSPWYRAHQQLRAGQPDVARTLLVADFNDPSPVNWWPPDAAPLRALEELVGLLPRPYPHGRSFSDFVLSGILLRLGEYDTAAHYAATAYNSGRPAMLAVHVARAAAALGDHGTALAWLRTAAMTAPSHSLQTAIAVAPEFDAMRMDPAFAETLAS